MKNSKDAECMRMVLVYARDHRGGEEPLPGVVLRAYPRAADGSQLVDVKRFGYTTHDEVYTSIPIGDFGEKPAGGVYCTYNAHQTKLHETMAEKQSS